MKWMPPDDLLLNHDFVMIGYRGVDGSTVLACPTVQEALKNNTDLLSEESLKNLGKAWKVDAQRLASHGVDLDGYTMKEVIEDAETARKALNYRRIHLLSESYGTRVAYLYGLSHPESISRSAMLGVNPPGHFDWDPRTIDTQLRYYSDLWSKDSVMSEKSPDLYATMKRVLDSLPRKWLIFSINPGKVRVVTFVLLFHRNTAAMVFDSYVAAEHGDPSGLALMSLAADYVLPSMFTWGDLASKAVSADYDSSKGYPDEADSSSAPLGSPLSKLLWGSLAYGSWPVMQLPEQFRSRKKSDVETLLLSGSIDFSTPAEFATQELLPYLPNGKQITLSEFGHVGDIWKVRPEMTARMLESFYRTGSPDTTGYAHIPMDFNVNWGFPGMVKAALVVGAVVVTALVTGLVLLVR